MIGKHWKLAFTSIALIVACTVSSGSAASFPNSDIELVVGYGPGGAYSTYALALAPILSRYLPNGRKVIVRYMPGGGSVTAAEYVQRARPDGTTIGIYNVFGLGGTQLVRSVHFDLTKVTWLARVAVDHEVGFVVGNGPIKAVGDLRNQTKPAYILSTQGLAATGTIAAAVLFDKMGVKWTALNNSELGPAVLAVIRGDADMYFGTYESTHSYIQSNQLRPIVFFGKRSERPADLAKVPVPSDLGYPDLDNIVPSRLIGGPPGMPPDVTKTLETAIAKAMRDPQFTDAMAKSKLTIDYANGAESAKEAAGTIGYFTRYSSTMQKLLK